MSFDKKINQLLEIIDTQLLSVINGNNTPKECIYLDLPYHTNIGDIFIWYGTEHFLKRAGLKCLYRSSLSTYSEQKMSGVSKNREVFIFLHGGGNFGDLWERHHNFRKKIITDYSDNKIIILPQTVFYTDDNKMKNDVELFARHRNLTICARDKKSYQILKDNFQNEIILVPDMAFCIPRVEIQRYRVPEIIGSTLFLRRTDRETNNSIDCLRYISQKQFDVQDWITIDNHYKEEKILLRLSYSKRISKFVADLYAQKIFQKIIVNKGVKQISKYENVYTNRLHVAILSVLLGKSFVFFDNSYGKNRAFYETWFGDLETIKFL